jgi:hypothetical protein
MRALYREKGIQGLYKGNVACLIRDVPGVAIQFAVYEHLKGNYLKDDTLHLSLFESLVVGTGSATVGWLFSYPQDVIKTKIQLSAEGRYKNGRWFKDGGFVACGKEIYKGSGYRGFLVGIEACLIRAFYAEGIGIAAYEKCR